MTMAEGIHTRIAPMPAGADAAARARLAGRPATGPLLLAAAIPALLLHVAYQPAVTFDLGPTTVAPSLADAAIWAVALYALVSAVRRRARPHLSRALPLLLGAAFLVVILVATLAPALAAPGPRLADHLITAAKFAQYAALGFALPVIVRRRADLAPPAWALALWTAAAAVVGLLQFTGLREPLHMLGSATAFDAWFAGDRQPSFLGTQDFAAVGAVTLAMGLALAMTGGGRAERALAGVAIAGGTLAVVLSGALAGTLAAMLAVGGAGAYALVRRRGVARMALVATVALVAIAGVLALRGDHLSGFAQTRGGTVAPVSPAPVSPGAPAPPTPVPEVQSYDQRLLLGYIGLRVFADHPLVGVGWQGTLEERGYGPYLDEARERFPGQPPFAFPAPEHPWGPHNSYIQALADLGLVGGLLLLGMLAAGVGTAGRAALRCPPAAAGPALAAALTLLAVVGALNGTGLFAGVPLNALLWLSLGLAVVGARHAREEAR
jgi:O-antigen ligase